MTTGTAQPNSGFGYIFNSFLGQQDWGHGQGNDEEAANCHNEDGLRGDQHGDDQNNPLGQCGRENYIGGLQAAQTSRERDEERPNQQAFALPGMKARPKVKYCFQWIVVLIVSHSQ